MQITISKTLQSARLIILLLVLSMVFSACGGESGGKTADSSSTATDIGTGTNVDNPTGDATGDAAEGVGDTTADNSTDEPANPVISAVAQERREGEAAPDFTAELINGDSFTLSDHLGKVVFLNFWATWCPPCVAEMPAIQELSETYKDSAVFIGMNIAEDPSVVREFIEDGGYTYYVGLDMYAEISDLYPTQGIPYTLVIDADGIISTIFLGGGDQMHDIFESAILDALK